MGFLLIRVWELVRGICTMYVRCSSPPGSQQALAVNVNPENIVSRRRARVTVCQPIHMTTTGCSLVGLNYP
ncbi:hypothetical protein MLD38_035215 [Melastoma candidum]|uniref:Uncharacterized protein n=1 Tax=Melastoma candidum TaxID=119954 RepID=A0ACB9ME64_9MYRT|nr:hypothetical protein MLD38_035215 [Melastoma candidum]